MTAGRVLVLIQVASLAGHQSRTEAELCAKPLAQICTFFVGGFVGGLNFCSCKRHCFLITLQLLERGAFLFYCIFSVHLCKIRKHARKITNKNCAVRIARGRMVRSWIFEKNPGMLPLLTLRFEFDTIGVEFYAGGYYAYL